MNNFCIFPLVDTKTLAQAQTIDWDAFGQRAKDDILQALTGDEQFRTSENCAHRQDERYLSDQG
jgi:hypothetical protein